MADFRYTPTHFDGVDLTGAAFESVEFDSVNGPLQTQTVEANTAVVIGLGDRFVSQQPEGATWDVKIVAASRDEAHKLTIMQTFSTEREFVYLRADDGDGVNWRIACSVIAIEGVPRKPLLWIAHLDVPNTVWQKNTATTTTGNLTAMSGDSDTQAVTLAGDRKSRPVLVVDPQAVKGGDPSKDFTFIRRGFFLSRAPLPWNNLPLAVTDNNGVPTTGIDTTDLTRDNGTTGTLAGGIGLATDPIVLNGGHGFADGAQFFYIDAEGANDEEQIFGVLTGNNIAVTERGIGGTDPDTHGAGAVVNKSSMMADGSDMRVYVDGVEVERWVGRIRETTTRVWINADMPAVTTLSLRDDLAIGATELYVKEGVGALSNRGVIEIDRELIGYTTKDVKTGKLSGLLRGLWWAQLALSHAADDPIYVAHHRFVLAFGRHGLGPAPDRIERRPAIDLEQSTNAKWYYGDQASDPLTIIHDPSQPGRTAQFLPDFEVDPADNNNAVPLLLDTSLEKAAWKDSPAEAGKLQVGRLTLRLPQGIKAAVDAILYDAQPRRSTRLRMLGRDATGQEVELLDLTDVDEGARNGDGLEPDAVLHELTLNAVRSYTLGEVPGEAMVAFTIGIDVVGEGVVQKFILDQETPMGGILLLLRDVGATGTYTFQVQILDDTGDEPEEGRVLWRNNAGFADTGPELTDAFVWYAYGSGAAGTFKTATFPAGTYYLQVVVSIQPGAGELRIGLGDGVRTKHNHLRWAASGPASWQDIVNGVLHFRLLHAHGGPIQPEAALMLHGTEANFDKIILTMDPDQLPWVDRPNNVDFDAYHASGKWINNDTGDEIAIDSFIATNETLEIDTEHRIVLRKELTWEEESFAAIIPSNPVDWLPFDPLVGGGTNDLKYEDPDMADTDGSAVHRDAKV